MMSQESIRRVFKKAINRRLVEPVVEFVTYDKGRKKVLHYELKRNISFANKKYAKLRIFEVADRTT